MGNQGSNGVTRHWALLGLLLGATTSIVLGIATQTAVAAGPTPSFLVQAAGPSVSGLSTPTSLADVLLGPGVSLAPGSEPLVNLQTSAQLPNPSPECTVSPPPSPRDGCSPLPSFGRFTDGSADLGIASGLLITANASAASFRTPGSTQQIALNRSTTSTPAPRDAIDLLATASAGLSPSPTSANNVTSLSFELAPPASAQDRYLKFEYSLLITEFGTWNGTSWASGSDMFFFPDGFALFTGGTGVANNCAVIPQSTTYLSMRSAGVVAPEEAFATGKAAAQANLSQLVAGGPNNGIAFPTGELVSGSYSDNGNWVVEFLTVPLTCVYDAATEVAAGSPVSVEIAIADLNDSAVPPAAIFAADSVRWSSSPTPTQEARLEVTRSGSGSGTVTSAPAGIDCGQACSANFTLNSTVTLTATPASGSTFTGWSGSGCSGSGTCEVTMSEARSVEATFTADSPPPPTPSGKPNLKVSFTTPKKVTGGKPFRVKVKVTNQSNAGSVANSVKSCLVVPSPLVVVKAKGGKVTGRTVCWTRSKLGIGKAATYPVTLRAPLSTSGSESLRATVEADNASGQSSSGSGRAKITVRKGKAPKPKPPTG